MITTRPVSTSLLSLGVARNVDRTVDGRNPARPCIDLIYKKCRNSGSIVYTSICIYIYTYIYYTENICIYGAPPPRTYRFSNSCQLAQLQRQKNIENKSMFLQG